MLVRFAITGPQPKSKGAVTEVRFVEEEVNHQKAATVEAVRLMARIEELERIGREYVAKTDPLLDKLEPMSNRIVELEARIIDTMETIGSLETALEKIEAEAHRGITLERNARSSLQNIVMLARRTP